MQLMIMEMNGMGIINDNGNDGMGIINDNGNEWNGCN
jgi:hypothetical protein